MSSPGGGYPDWQRITQWFGTPLAAETGKVINAVAYPLGPFNARNFASIVVCLAPTVQNVTVTIKQQVPSGPGSLLVTTTYVVNAGNVDFRAIVLLAGAVSVSFTGAGAGTTIDYSIVPSNANTNAEVSTLAQLGFQHNGAAVGNETAVDFEDGTSITFTVVDDPANSRVKVTPVFTLPTDAGGWSSVAGAFTYSSADGPTGIMNTPSDLTATIGLGDRIKYVQSGTTKYGIVTAITAALITFYGGTDYVLTNVAITGFNYSHVKRPLGFNTSPAKWQEEIVATNTPNKTTPTSNTWYGGTGLTPTGPSLDMPIGAWRVEFEGSMRTENNNGAGGTSTASVSSTLSTANNSETDTGFNSYAYNQALSSAGSDFDIAVPFYKSKIVTVAAKTTYYANLKCTGNGTLGVVRFGDGSMSATIRYTCAYL